MFSVRYIFLEIFFQQIQWVEKLIVRGLQNFCFTKLTLKLALICQELALLLRNCFYLRFKFFLHLCYCFNEITCFLNQLVLFNHLSFLFLWKLSFNNTFVQLLNNFFSPLNNVLSWLALLRLINYLMDYVELGKTSSTIF